MKGDKAPLNKHVRSCRTRACSRISRIVHVLINERDQFFHKHLPQHSLLMFVVPGILFIAHRIPLVPGK